jgi:hypothetical protein
MFSLPTSVHVTGLSGLEITDFLSTCDDDAFRRWWPGTHLHFHTVKGTPGKVGSVIFLDELVGDRHVKLTCDLTELVPGRKLVWHRDDDTGVQIEQSIQAGFSGFASLLDPVFRLFFSPNFAAAKDEHVRTEFPKLRNLLRKERLACPPGPDNVT